MESSPFAPYHEFAVSGSKERINSSFTIFLHLTNASPVAIHYPCLALVFECSFCEWTRFSSNKLITTTGIFRSNATVRELSYMFFNSPLDEFIYVIFGFIAQTALVANVKES